MYIPSSKLYTDINSSDDCQWLSMGDGPLRSTVKYSYLASNDHRPWDGRIRYQYVGHHDRVLATKR
jgi:hypothetical protein